MIREARRRNPSPAITTGSAAWTRYEYPAEAFDLVISNLALHYVEDLEAVYKRVRRTLKPSGIFLFNIEHPVFTAGIREDWIYDGGTPLCWPVDNYFYPGERQVRFLDHTVKKYHHTLTQILMGLLRNGFRLKPWRRPSRLRRCWRSPACGTKCAAHDASCKGSKDRKE